MKLCPKCGHEVDNNGWHVTTTPHCRYFYKCVPPPTSRILYSKVNKYDVFPGAKSTEKECCPNCAVYGVTAYLMGEQHIIPDPQGDIISDECPVPRAQELASHRWGTLKTSFIQELENQSIQCDHPYTFDELADIGDSFKEEK